MTLNKTLSAFFFLLLLTLNLSATVQSPDILLIKSDTVYLKTFPLEELELQYRPFGLTLSTAPSSACWRGYQAIWRLQNDSLFLEKILECTIGSERFSIDANEWRPISKNELFKEENLPELFRKNGLDYKMLGNKVFAGWYNGELVEPSHKGAWHYTLKGFKKTLYESRIFQNRKKKIRKAKIQLKFEQGIAATNFLESKISEYQNEHSFKVKLCEEPPSFVRCGSDVIIVGYKFEVLDSDLTHLIGKYIVGYEKCPEFRGKDFFEKDRTYFITAKRYNGFGSPIILNDYKKEKLPIFENKRIVRIHEAFQAKGANDYCYLNKDKNAQINKEGKILLHNSNNDSLFISPSKVSHLHFSPEWYKTEFPKEVFNFPNLQHLWIGMRSIEELPREITQLTALKTIDMQHSSLKQLPENIGDLQELEELVLLFTDIEELPVSICELSNLKKLQLGGTKIKRLPSCLAELQQLEEFVLFSGKGELPESVLKEVSELRKSLPNCNFHVE